jgi:beta-glucosidase
LRFSKFHFASVAGAAILSLQLVISATPADRDEPLYKSRTAAIPARVHDLLARMSLDEKIDLLGGDEFQEFQTKPNARLGIPALKMTDSSSTVFPSGISMGASFDRDLVYKVATAMSVEARAEGSDMLLGPYAGLSRIPFGGRNFESMGEDPYLTSELVASYVDAENDQKILGCVKHFALNDQEYHRMSIDSIADERTLHELHLVPYERAVKEGVGCVMASYNKINGLWATENTALLTSILKQQWGFPGFVISDWGSTHSTVPAALAGLDLEMPTGEFFTAKLSQAVKDGQVPERLIDDKVSRILGQMFRIGSFDGADRLRPNRSVINGPEHKALALRLARESIVLLKNDGLVLPMDLNRTHKIAVIGPNANSFVAGGGSSEVDPDSYVSVLKGLRDRVGARAKIGFAEGVLASGMAINSAYLTPSRGSGQGLYGEYFDNPDLNGQPVTTGVDPTIDFYWDSIDPPDPKLKGVKFSVRWTGELHAPVSGTYSLYTQSDDGVRLWINDKELIDNWTDHATTTDAGSVRLAAGRPYKIRLEYYQRSGDARIQLAWAPPADKLMAAAVKLAAASDTAVIVAGFNQNLEGEGTDRYTFDLPAEQVRLIKAVAKVNPRTVVVITTGNPVAMKSWIKNVPAVLYAWYPGEQGGAAIADLLLGIESPSGRLPVTMPVRWQDSPAYGSYPEKNGTVPYQEGIYLGYRYFDKSSVRPLFPFGFGLSYTSFAYSDLKIAAIDSETRHPVIDVSFTLTNIGHRAGREVAQVYVEPHTRKVDRPLRELKGFEKILLQPGEHRTVHVRLTQRSFAYYDSNANDFRVGAGDYTIRVGASSRDFRLSAEIKLND